MARDDVPQTDLPYQTIVHPLIKLFCGASDCEWWEERHHSIFQIKPTSQGAVMRFQVKRRSPPIWHQLPDDDIFGQCRNMEAVPNVRSARQRV